jgi:hypothetical protein
MAQDRTGDFQRLCQQAVRAAGSAGAAAALEHKPSPQSAIQENAQFNAAASDISKEVYQASKRLQQLTQRK